MTPKTFLTTSAIGLLMATSAAAQTDVEVLTEDEIAEANEAADQMYLQVYGENAPAYVTVNEAIERMEAMGYTNIHDLDVEWGVYEVEAYAPDGNEVEIEFDPVTGAILEVTDNWF
ncbi:PepSY domain-containing protein [Citreimonas salinaria]|uniref:Peptidase propeptide and YPEB domain-containing protein n=1 Tax=Citreimonas salinaria TaxID=321339 RepID=A0A1H3H5M0_9RHOB|nr:PepSY domain-containing protein [Citreimonas salinaria]SDY10515.1 Peptidase propeptide and YPEB domain-containing protein [Citreimonas salinaria]